MNNEQPVALVTGASRGIGRSIAVMLHAEGYRLALVSRRLDGLQDTACLCSGGESEDMVTIAADLTKPEAPGQIMARIRDEFGRLDLLVNNAGAVASGPIGSYTIEQWEYVMGLNARAPFFLMQEAVPLLRSAPHGLIVNIGSVVSKAGYADQALYTASKHALLGMTKVAARDLAPDGIRVHALLPGGVNTAMVSDVRPDIDTSELISPDDVAETVQFLLSMKGNAVIDELLIRRATKAAWSV